MYRIITASNKPLKFSKYDLDIVETLCEDYPDLIKRSDVRKLRSNLNDMSANNLSELKRALNHVGDAEDESDEYDEDDYIVQQAVNDFGILLKSIISNM